MKILNIYHKKLNYYLYIFLKVKTNHLKFISSLQSVNNFLHDYLYLISLILRIKILK
jgi:hypothetical protein